MMRTAVAIIGIMLLSPSVHMDGSSTRSASNRRFLLEDFKKHQWCAYAGESEWKAEVKSRSAMVVATVEFAKDHVSKINMTEEDETSDWIIYDNYLFNNGEVSSVKRTINVLPGDLSQEGTYSVLHGKATKQSSTTRKLSNKEVLPSTEPNESFPRTRLFTRLDDFPFASLILANHAETANDSRVCVSLKQP